MDNGDESLPQELLCHVINFLDSGSKLALSEVSKFMCSFPSVQKCRSKSLRSPKYLIYPVSCHVDKIMYPLNGIPLIKQFLVEWKEIVPEDSSQYRVSLLTRRIFHEKLDVCFVGICANNARDSNKRLFTGKMRVEDYQGTILFEVEYEGDCSRSRQKIKNLRYLVTTNLTPRNSDLISFFKETFLLQCLLGGSMEGEQGKCHALWWHKES